MRGAFDIVDVLRDGDLNSVQTGCAEGIRRCTAIMQSLLDDVQDATKFDPPRPALRVESFQWRVLLDQVIVSLLPRAHDRGVEMRARVVAPEAEFVSGDRETIARLATLLVEHGIRFAKQGGEVMLESTAVPGASASTRLYRLSVSHLLPDSVPIGRAVTGTEDRRQLVVRQNIEMGGCGIIVEHGEQWNTTSWFEVPLRVDGDRRISDTGDTPQAQRTSSALSRKPR